VTLYEALAGSPPHGDHDVRSLMRKLQEDAPPLETRVRVPGPLGASIMAAVARDPARRPSAEQFATMLAATEAIALPEPMPVAGWTRTQKLVVAALAVLALLVLIWRVSSRSSSSTPSLGATPQTQEERAEEDPATESDQPTVDQDGNPVDDEAYDQANRRGRGHGKKHHRD
jgi:hypothetical protein